MHILNRLSWAFSIAHLLLVLGCNSAPVRLTVFSDVCVYGATAGGVTAAVQAARMGKRAVLVDPGSHLGGLTTGGLGATDTGNKQAIGGLAREFYRRLGNRYGKDEAWTFEPHVAEEVFRVMVEEAKVQVYLGQALFEVTREAGRVAEIVTVDSHPSGPTLSTTEFRARQYIDATYEGDLMAHVGVKYTVGREANSIYGETLNGIRAETPKHQFSVKVDPYVTPGDPASGLIPLIQPGDGGKPGEGDHRVQAYNFRLCLTQEAGNRKPIEPPADYDPARYELLARTIEALIKAGKTPRLADFLSIIMMPGGKTDMNNNGPISTDYIGGSYGYPEVGQRELIWMEHKSYTRGFLWFLATSPRVPESLRKETASWGLAADEFPDTAGWPRQLYVREARRMVSDYVMTEKDCRGQTKAHDSVGMGSYGMDSHNCQRIVRSDGKSAWVENEGDVQERVAGPYPISYRSIVPRAKDCPNLIVPVCLSASHIAFGSIRMEPVFMVLGQSAATAACLAIDAGCAVQAVDYAQLRERLLADGQVLEAAGGDARIP